ncbi:MAG: sulfotransferase [Synechococcus sp.]
MPPHSQQMIKPRVLYITSRGHSGSTLLSLLVCGHSQVVSAGELKMLSNPDPQRRLCSCHRQVPSECPFWRAVEQRVKDRIGCSLDQLLLVDGGGDATFLRHNEALFAAIAEESGQALIVDSSKSLPRLSRLLMAEAQGAAFALHPVHLHRGPFGSMNSARKRGEVLRQAAYNYVRLFFMTRERLRGVRALRVSYEQLALDPRAEMARVMAWLNLPLEEGQFQWRDGVRRDIHGNDMRFGRSDQIRLDQSWRQQLTWSQKLGVLVWTLPVRLRSPWLFRRVRRWIKPGVDPFP